jgi:hypothetical protein
MIAKFLRSLGFVFAVILCLAAGTATAQFNAGLSGTVFDSTKAAIPGATVTLTNTQTQQSQTVKSGGTGSYQFNELTPGTYNLQVTANGFEQDMVSNISIVAESPRSVDVTLATGQESQTVTVNGDSLPTLQTSDGSIGRTISSEEIERLPLFGGDPYELLRTAPGITGDGARSGNGTAVFLPNNVGVGGSNSGIYQTENQPQISADGQRVADNNLMIDGVAVDSLVHGGSAVVSPNQESVASITVVSTSYDAADGRNTGAQIKTISKSGTNEIHGSFFFRYNEPGLNAYNRYAGPVAGSEPSRVAIKSRTYAASIGGPILKDKLFLFSSYQGYGQGNNTVSSPTYFETSQFRAAVIAARPNFLVTQTLQSGGITPRVYAPVAANCSLWANNQGEFFPTQVNGSGPIVTQTATSGPYCNVVTGGLDVGSLTPGSATAAKGAYLSVFSNGNTAAPGPSNVVGGGLFGAGLDGVPDIAEGQMYVPSHSRGNQFQGRVDFQATKKDLIAVSLFITKLDNLTSTDNVSRAIGDVPFKPLNSAATLIYNRVISNSWLNQFRANATRFADDGPNDFGGINLGIPYTYVQNLPTNNIDFGVQGGSTTPAILAQNTYEVSDLAIKTFGSHNIKFGGGYRWEQDNDNLLGGVRPDYAFAGLWNLANDAPLFESQTVNPVTGLEPNTAAHFRSQTMYVFIQHDWKATPTFTLNTGFRYEIYTPWHRKGGAPSYLPEFGTTSAGPLVGLTLQPVSNLYNTDYGHYAPKVGFAWNPNYYQNRFVVRGGFAIAYNHLDLSLFENSVENGPGVFSFGVCCGTSSLDFGTPFDGGNILYVHGNGSNLNSFAPNPAFTTGVSDSGFPNQSPGSNPATIEIYSAGKVIRNPVSYLYSLDTETLMPGGFTLTLGYAGSVGRHYARLVNQNFLYPNSGTVGGVTVSTLANPLFLAETDSSQAYNSLNAHVQKKMSHGFQFDGTYTWSKAMDNITNGDQSDGSANQTDPGNNKAEWGPSDNDVRNRFTGVALYTTPRVTLHNKFLQEVVNGYQATTIVTLLSGFHWTPTVNNGINLVPNSDTVSPIRPIAFAPGVGVSTLGQSCSNGALKSGSNFPNRGSGGTAGGINYFSTASPATPALYVPIIGRNSQMGPCYRNIDITVAKQITLEGWGHTGVLRFQANMYNVFNLLQLQPITNEASNTNIQNQNFGQSLGADAGRVIEFLARFQF